MATPPTERRTDTIKERTRSIEDSLTHSTDGGESDDGKTNRSDILSRISKMGQPMLPMGGETPPTDSTTEV